MPSYWKSLPDAGQSRTRRPPAFLIENYVVGDFDIRSLASPAAAPLVSKRPKRAASASLKASTSTAAAATKKKVVASSTRQTKQRRQERVNHVRHNAPVRVANVASTSVSFADQQLGKSTTTVAAPFKMVPSATQVKGNMDPSKWKFATSCTSSVDKQTLDYLLDSVYYEPGVINQHVQQGKKNMECNVEICFSFDCTGSMIKCLDELRAKLHACCSQLLADLPSLRIAMIAHGDYKASTASRFKYAMKKMDFTNDIATMDKFVRSCEQTGGYDFPECYEMVLHEAQHLNWSTNNEKVMKILVLIGDDIPHSVNNNFDNGFNMLKLDWKVELQNLKKLLGNEDQGFDNFRVFSVQCPGRPHATEFYEHLAEQTHGQRLTLDSFQSMTEIFIGMCYRAESDVQLREHHEAIAAMQEKSLIVQPSASGASSSSSSSSSSTQQQLFTDEEIMQIHTAIHDPNSKHVKIQGIEYEISVGAAGCRFVRIHERTFIEQNKAKKTKYAIMATEGKKITWIVQSGSWGLIIENQVVRRGSESDAMDE